MNDGTKPHPAVSLNDGEEIVQQFKEKFNSTRSVRLRILTVLPKSWSGHKVAKVFGVSRYLARRAKMLVASRERCSVKPQPQIKQDTFCANGRRS